MRSSKGVDCKTLFGRDLRLIENEMRVFCTCETAFVPASTLDVVFIAVAVVIGLLWFLLEIWKLDEGENVWVAVVAFIVVDAACVVCPDWKDDDICNTPEDDDFC